MIPTHSQLDRWSCVLLFCVRAVVVFGLTASAELVAAVPATAADAPAATTVIDQHFATQESVKSALAELNKLAQQTLDKTGVPGLAIGVVYDDQVVELKGFGVRQVGKKEPVDADTVFELASVSKSITSTVLAAS